MVLFFFFFKIKENENGKFGNFDSGCHSGYARLPAAVQENEPAFIPSKELRGKPKRGPGRGRKSSLDSGYV